MKPLFVLLTSLTLSLSFACSSDDPDDPDNPDNPGNPPGDGDMSFFVTSSGTGASGGDLGGLAGADQRCQDLAAAAGAGDLTWCAYLSTDAVDARDRIGTGPWHGADGTQIAADVNGLHDDGVGVALMLDESGNAVPRNEHDLLTGSGADGRATDECGRATGCTCLNWTDSTRTAFGWVGHTDSEPENWNDGRHETRCDEQGMGFVNGSGRTMCFATNAGSCPR